MAKWFNSVLVCVIALCTALTVALSGCYTSSTVIDAGSAPTTYHTVVLPDLEIYIVKEGDTLYSIARLFNVELHDVLLANPGVEPTDLQPGRTIHVPRPRKLPVRVVPDPKVSTDPKLPKNAELPPPKTAGHAGPLPAESSFVWPLRGTILAEYGRPVAWRRWEHNRGIDIRATPGQLIVAAKSGKVNTFENVPGFARSVVLEHGDGTLTFYGHLDQVLVPHGRWIKQGEGLASAGSSARSNGVQLHFRVLRGGQFIDPMSVLR